VTVRCVPELGSSFEVQLPLQPSGAHESKLAAAEIAAANPAELR
jgi:hypothetical protein